MFGVHLSRRTGTMGGENRGDYAGGADKERAEGGAEQGGGESVNDTGKESAGTAGNEPSEPSSAPSAGSDSGDQSTEGSAAEG